MVEISVNTGAGGDFTPLPEGDHTCLVTSFELFESKQGNPTLKVEFTVAEGPFQDRKIWDNLSLLENARWRTGGFFKCLGAPDIDGDQRLNTDEYLNRPVIVCTHNEQYNGKTQVRVKPDGYKQHPAVTEHLAKTAGEAPQPTPTPTPTPAPATTGNGGFSL
jgi:hypothetical protein